MSQTFTLKTGAAAVLATAAMTFSASGLAAEAVVYTSNNVQVIDVALDIAKDKARDLTVQRVTSGTGALMKRIEAEAANPLGDVVWGAGFGTMAAFQHNFQAYDSAEAKGMDKRFLGLNNLWAGTHPLVTVLMVNDKHTKGEDEPQ